MAVARVRKNKKWKVQFKVWMEIKGHTGNNGGER